MFTTSHLIYSWALAKKTEEVPHTAKKRTTAFILGAILPDTPTYLFVLVCGVILGIPHEVLWDDMYFNSLWSIPITLTHSFIIWPISIAISSYFGWKFLKWLSISAFFHALVDFCVHTDDAYKHFWPFSDWTFKSPISYWNNAEYGSYVSAFDSLFVLFLLFFLYHTYGKEHRLLRVCVVFFSLIYTLNVLAKPVIGLLSR